MAPLPHYSVAAPDEYLALTGMGIESVKIAKSAWIYPFQRCTRFSVQPHDYAMSLQAMTKEKLQFLLPVVFTVGPDVNARGANAKSGAQTGQVHNQEDRGDSLMKYAMLLTDTSAKGKNATAHLDNIVKGIIEGETRVLVSSMTMEEIFTEREEFKRRIFRNIQSELDQFGLKIYNANVKELRDAPESNYFESLARKAHEGAINQARIDVADAQQKGSVGEAERKGRQERELARINAETAVQKTERDGERASAESALDTRKTTLKRDLDIARITAARATEARDAELKRDVEIKRAAAETERLRASDVVKASIAREAKQHAADAKAYEVQADATAQLAKTNQATDADAYRTRVGADAASYAALKDADARLQARVKEAEGLTAMAQAYAHMAQAFGGPAGLLQYMMVEKGTYVELAHANAKAVAGMQPKISVWTTGPHAQAGGGGGGGGGGEAGEAGAPGGGSSSSIDTMRNVYQMLPPLMQTINEQTGITLPEWQFGRLNNSQAAEVEKSKEVAKTNGHK